MIKFGKKINMYVWGAIVVAILAGLYYLKTREGFQDAPPSTGVMPSTGAMGAMPSTGAMGAMPAMPPMPPMPPMTTPTAVKPVKPVDKKPTPAEVRSKANELMALVNKM